MTITITIPTLTITGTDILACTILGGFIAAVCWLVRI